MSVPDIKFIDLVAQYRMIQHEIESAIHEALERGDFIQGYDVHELEKELGIFCEIEHVVGVANGTDALFLAMKALGIGAGDAIVCPSFTFAATAEAIVLAGATPIFIDVNDFDYNIDVALLTDCLASAQKSGLALRGVIAVDLFGHPARYTELEDFCCTNKLHLICDAAQSLGSTYNGKKIGQLGDVTCTSFFPSKPLGCYGDGGAILTRDAGLADLVRSLACHGRGGHKYENVRIGINSRLDTIQAAVLREKLKIFPGELKSRCDIAARYTSCLTTKIDVPEQKPSTLASWAQYTVKLRGKCRRNFISEMMRRGVPTAVYYPKPLHRQEAYQSFPIVNGSLPVTDHLCNEVVSLPMHPYMSEEIQDYIIRCVAEVIDAI